MEEYPSEKISGEIGEIGEYSVGCCDTSISTAVNG